MTSRLPWNPVTLYQVVTKTRGPRSPRVVAYNVLESASRKSVQAHPGCPLPGGYERMTDRQISDCRICKSPAEAVAAYEGSLKRALEDLLKRRASLQQEIEALVEAIEEVPSIEVTAEEPR